MYSKLTIMAKEKKTNKQQLYEAYTNHVLEQEQFPKSVYAFCKANEISEADFYAHFGSLEALRDSIWTAFYDNSEQLLQKNKDFEAASRKDKLLSFYYTFFEVLLLNRSYILFVLDKTVKPLEKMEQLRGLRQKFKAFATELIEDGNAEKNSRLTQHPPQLFSEAAWVQLMFLLKFWLEDRSAGFEKTDMAIEKSVQTAFDVFDNTPLNALVDFGKFIWKEKFQPTA